MKGISLFIMLLKVGNHINMYNQTPTKTNKKDKVVEKEDEKNDRGQYVFFFWSYSRPLKSIKMTY